MLMLTKTIKQYSFPFEKIKNFNFESLEKLGYEFRDTKNFFYSRFSGISYINKLKDKYTIRDEIIKENLKNISKILARYWKICLSHVLGNIKTLLENTKKLMKKATYNNSNLSEKDRHYIYTVLKSSEYLENVLRRKKLPDYLYEKFKINHKKLNNLIRRYFRRYKNKIPYSKKNNFLVLDSGLYKYKDGFLKISTLNKGKRIDFKIKDERVFKGNLTIKWENCLTVFGTKKINPAYTSQICHICDSFGTRNGETFTCQCCQNKMDADVNAAYNIRKRKNIKEIDLYTNTKKVKQYYENLKKGEATFKI